MLLPTFAVGRAQELLQLFAQRIRSQQASDTVLEKMEIVYDGMIEDSMQTYHAFVRNEWLADNVVTYKHDHNDSKPFLPEQAWTPSQVAERERLITDAGNGKTVPVIVAPSGMFTGGWSPWYLWQLTEQCETARVFITGFQAAYTPGRALLEAEEESVEVEITGLMEPEQADDLMSEGFGIHRKSITVHRNWVSRIDGFSAHAARQGLLHFAREVDPASIHLIHGEAETIKTFRNYLQENTSAMVSTAAKGVSVPIDWATAKSGLTPSEKNEPTETTEQPATTATDAIDKEIDTVQERLDSEALGLTSESDTFTEEQEARIRKIRRRQTTPPEELRVFRSPEEFERREKPPKET